MRTIHTEEIISNIKEMCIEANHMLTADMQKALEENLIEHDVFIAAAAVSDFTVDESASKISSSRGETLQLKVAPKIINQAKEHNPAVYLVGFKAEYGVSHEKLVESAKNRMRESGADLMVANDVAEAGAGFGSDQNKVVLVDDEVWDVPLSTKEEISALVIGRIIERII